MDQKWQPDAVAEKIISDVTSALNWYTILYIGTGAAIIAVSVPMFFLSPHRQETNSNFGIDDMATAAISTAALVLIVAAVVSAKLFSRWRESRDDIAGLSAAFSAVLSSQKLPAEEKGIRITQIYSSHTIGKILQALHKTRSRIVLWGGLVILPQVAIFASILIGVDFMEETNTETDDMMLGLVMYFWILSAAAAFVLIRYLMISRSAQERIRVVSSRLFDLYSTLHFDEARQRRFDLFIDESVQKATAITLRDYKWMLPAGIFCLICGLLLITFAIHKLAFVDEAELTLLVSELVAGVLLGFVGTTFLRLKKDNMALIRSLHSWNKPATRH